MITDRIVFRDQQRRKKECSFNSAAALDPDSLNAFRKPASVRNALNTWGYYFFSKTSKHVLFESRLECSHLILFDFDPDVVTVLGQPFQIWVDGHPHVPDFFARRRDGSREVFDVKPAEIAAEEKHQAVFARTRAVCKRIGWGYTVLHEPSNLTLFENVRWLAGYRNAPQADPSLRARILDAAGTGCAVAELVDAVGEPPPLVRPLIFHLLWLHELKAELGNELLDQSTVLQKGVNEHGV